MCTMQALLLAGLVWSALGHTDEASEGVRAEATQVVVRAEAKEFPFTVGREREGRGVAFFLGVLIGVLIGVLTMRFIWKDSKDLPCEIDDDAESEDDEVDEVKIPPPIPEGPRPPRKVYFTPHGTKAHTTEKCETIRKYSKETLWCKKCALGLFLEAVDYPQDRGYFCSKRGA